MENPLGSKGALITKLSNLVKKMWYDSKGSIAPFSFKKIIGDLQPQVIIFKYAFSFKGISNTTPKS
jgi:hypothetical protein